jgi:hypothetical protein
MVGARTGRDPARTHRPMRTLRSAIPIASILLLCCGCRSREVSREPPTITFKPNSGVIQDWSLDVSGLPAIDATTHEVLIADRLEEGVMSTPALELRWLSPSAEEPRRTFSLVSRGEFFAVHSLGDDRRADATSRLAPIVRARADQANLLLRGAKLSGLARCTMQPPSAPCGSPATLQCGALTADFRANKLSWKHEGRDHATMPMSEREGIVRCLREAWSDSENTVLAVLVDSFCKEEPGDACGPPPKWRVIGLR